MSEIRRRLVPPLRLIERGLRRARLMAARARPRGSISRIAILHGHWDGGSVVKQFHTKKED